MILHYMLRYCGLDRNWLLLLLTILNCVIDAWVDWGLLWLRYFQLRLHNLARNISLT